jgi:hypothetical protein
LEVERIDVVDAYEEVSWLDEMDWMVDTLPPMALPKDHS